MSNNYQNILRGIAASPGQRQGLVKMVLSDDDFSKIEKGDIVVARFTTPFFTIHLLDASAIITDVGGITSHAATIARELGIPAVVGTQNATSLLHDGNRVFIDGSQGVVYYD